MRTLVFAVLLLFAPFAKAEGVASSQYEKAIGQAFSEFEQQNYAEARALFLEAHRSYPNARTLRALGMVEYELKSYVRSAEYLEAALNSEERPLTAEQRSQVEPLLKRAQGFIGRYTLTLHPQSALVTLDGERLTARDSPFSLSLPVGEHALDAEAAGYRSIRRVLHTEGGEQQTLEITLSQAATSARGDVGQKSSSDRPSTPVYKKWWLWTTVGLVVAAGVTAAVIATREHEPALPSNSSTHEVAYLLSWGR